MKRLFKGQTYIFLFLFMMLGLTALISIAQDTVARSSTIKTVTTTTENSVSIPTWAWVVGGIVLLIIIIALASRKKTASSHTDQVIYTKKTIKDE